MNVLMREQMCTRLIKYTDQSKSGSVQAEEMLKKNCHVSRASAATQLDN